MASRMFQGAGLQWLGASPTLRRTCHRIHSIAAVALAQHMQDAGLVEVGQVRQVPAHKWTFRRVGTAKRCKESRSVRQTAPLLLAAILV